MKKRHEQKLIVVSITTGLLLNVPFVMIFNVNDAVYGIPVFYIGVFLIWIVSVIVSFVIIKRHYE